MANAFARVVLTGFMGAGKSTLGPLLASALGWRFIDLDRAIEHAEGAAIPTLFERLGEPGFREAEARSAAPLLRERSLVLALGGGALEHPSTRAAVFGDPETHVVFLETSLPMALARCRAQNEVRPVLGDEEGLAARFDARQAHYRLAHTTLPAGKLTTQELLDEALRALGR